MFLLFSNLLTVKYTPRSILVDKGTRDIENILSESSSQCLDWNGIVYNNVLSEMNI